MKKLAGLLGLFLFTMVSNGQISFSNNFGKENQEIGREILQTQDGGYIMAGEVSGYPAEAVSSIYIVKTNSEGYLEWEKEINNGYRVRATSMDYTKDGGYILGGWYHGSGSLYTSDIIMVKMSEQGDTLWTKSFGGSKSDFAYSVKQMADDGFVIVGGTNYNGNSQAIIIKTDAYGDTIWTRMYGDEYFDIAESVHATPDSGCVVVGFTGISDYEGDMLILKYDKNGNEDWVTTIGGSLSQWGYSVDLTSDNGYVVTGTTQRLEGSIKLNDFYWVKLNAAGEKVWDNQYSVINMHIGKSIKTTRDNGFIIGGSLNGQNDGYEYFLIKVDEEGEIEWTNKIEGANGNNYLNSVIQTIDNGYAFTGSAQDASFNSNGTNMVLFKTNSLGQMIYNQTTNINITTEPTRNVLYPNPAKVNQYVYLKDFDVQSIVWFNQLGIKIKEQSNVRNNKIVLDNFEPGIYYYYGFSEEKKKCFGKLIIIE